MNVRFAALHAIREARASARRLGIYMVTITLGVAALVAINGYRENAQRSVREEARNLLGADVKLSAGRPLGEPVRALLDSAGAAGIPVADVVGTVTVALAGNGNTRLVQLRAVTGGYPFYGAVETEPAGLWDALGDAGIAIVEPAVLIALGIEPGDSIRIGTLWLPVAGVAPALPPEMSFRAAIGPRVFIAGADLAGTGLIGFGSLVRHEAYLALPGADGAGRFVEEHRQFLRVNEVAVETADGEAADIARGLEWLGRFLGLVGLMALLLGGLGVGSAIHVFIAGRRSTVAVLRCIGATQRTTFAAYLFQAALLGLAGAMLGAVIGVAVQALLPLLLDAALPFRTTFRFEPGPVIAGIATGAWVAVMFALLPLLEIRRIPPLAALRVEVEPPAAGRDPARTAAFTALLGSIVLLSIWQAPSIREGLAFAAAIAGALAVLWVAARMAIAIARRSLPRRAAFTLRQGVAGLFRPHNQTVAVTVALGFGMFLVAAIWTVQHNLLGMLRPGEPGKQPNLVAFDIQPDQVEGVRTILQSHGATAGDAVPIVTARIAAINGITTRALLDRSDGPEPWTLRREYRNTWRDTLTDAETLVAGEWWADTRPPGALPRISVEQDLAGDLDVTVGDTIVWDVQGIEIATEVASLRAVDWARYDTNFFVVFEGGVLDAAPHAWVMLAHLDDAGARARAQRDIVLASPNVSIVDVATVQETITRIVDRTALVIRFMALFSVVAGIIVLGGAISASRFQRVRESVLLRTLGATRRQIRHILLTEYATLGLLAGIVGTLLGGVAGALLVTRVFDLSLSVPFSRLALAVIAVAVLAAVIGVINGGEATRRTPLAALRES